MKEKFDQLLTKLVSLPGILIDSVSAVVADPKRLVVYVVVFGAIFDIVTGGELISKALQTVTQIIDLASERAVGIIGLAVAYLLFKRAG